MSTPETLRIVSANDLYDGDVVYLDGAGNWTRRIEEAATAVSDDEARALNEAAMQPSKVVGPYLVEVQLGADGRLRPTHYREQFRDLGPTNRPDLCRHATT